MRGQAEKHAKRQTISVLTRVRLCQKPGLKPVVPGMDFTNVSDHVEGSKGKLCVARKFLVGTVGIEKNGARNLERLGVCSICKTTYRLLEI